MCLGSRRTNDGSDGDASRQVDKTQEQAGRCPKQDAIFYKKRADTRALKLFATIDKFNNLHRNEGIAVILAQNKNNTGFNVFGTSVITSTVCSKVCAEHLPE